MSQTPILDAINSKRYDDALKLIRKTSEITEIDDRGKGALHVAAECGNLELVIELLKTPRIDVYSLASRRATNHYPLFIDFS